MTTYETTETRRRSTGFHNSFSRACLWAAVAAALFTLDHAPTWLTVAAIICTSSACAHTSDAIDAMLGRRQ